MSIEEIRKSYEVLYSKRGGILNKLILKAWLNHSESRSRSGNEAFSLSTYQRHINDATLLQQVELGMLQCGDIGGKSSIIDFLRNNTLATYSVK